MRQLLLDRTYQDMVAAMVPFANQETPTKKQLIAFEDFRININWGVFDFPFINLLINREIKTGFHKLIFRRLGAFLDDLIVRYETKEWFSLIVNASKAGKRFATQLTSASSKLANLCSQYERIPVQWCNSALFRQNLTPNTLQFKDTGVSKFNSIMFCLIGYDGKKRDPLSGAYPELNLQNHHQLCSVEVV